MNQINRYIDFLKRNRTSEESMDKYVRNLREEAVNLSRKLWTLDELIAIKSYEVLNATTEKSPYGVDYNYADIAKDISKGFKAGKFMSPLEIATQVKEEIERVAAGDKSAKRQGKALWTGNKRPRSENSTDDTAKKQKTKKSKKKAKNKDRKAPTMKEGDKGWTGIPFSNDPLKCTFCSKCRKYDNVNGLKFHGWSELSVNNRQPHKTDDHHKTDFKTNF